MDLTTPGNFIFIPDKEKNTTGTLYNLEPSHGFKKKTFVILPYQNPQRKKTVPEFYAITHKRTVDTGNLKNDAPSPSIYLKAVTSKQAYIDHVLQLKDQIHKGNIYEINYCIQFVAEGIEIDPLSVFLKLNELAKAPHPAFVRLGDAYIISASPELFLEKKGDYLFSKPIKGTIKRGKDKAEDEALKNELQTSLKERTENVMAVDVARNDLSRIAKKGSVHVNKLYHIETFETVHQMVSTVSCELKENTSFETIMGCTFPMASMTGAPKISAMQLIDASEDFKRGYYSGAMGLIDEQENFTLSVIIRSIFYNRSTKQLSIAVGGAITYLSEPEQEYEECLLKANALLKVLNAVIVE